MTYFDSKLSLHSTQADVVSSIEQRFRSSDVLARMMAMSDLSEAVSKLPPGSLAASGYNVLVATAADTLSQCEERGVAGHACEIFTQSVEAARQHLPSLLKYLERGFPGRHEPGLKCRAIVAVQNAGLLNAEVVRVLSGLAAQSSKECLDEVFFAKAALEDLEKRSTSPIEKSPLNDVDIPS